MPRKTPVPTSFFRGQSDRHLVTVELVIFVIAALPSAQVGKIIHKLDRRNPFDHFKPQFVFTAA
jgi:hypothetical protein